MIELRMGEQDVLRLRFAVSPIWETLAAVRGVAGNRLPPALGPWRAQVTPPLVPLLTAAQERGGYTPDFLTPPPAAGERSIEAEIALVAQTPLDVIEQELTRALHERRAPADSPCVLRDERGPGSRAEDAREERTGDPLRDAIADPAAARETVCRELSTAWETLLRPTWPRLHRVLATDVDHRSRRLVAGGIAALLDDLDPTVSWADGTLRVTGTVSEQRELAGEGVVLMPSLFTVGRPLVILDPPYQPTLIYAARGVATAFTVPVAPADALVRLLGRGRADLLAALDEPAGTGSLALAVQRSAGTVSEHLHALRAAGLAEVRRTGKRSRWTRTALGDALVAGPLSG